MAKASKLGTFGGVFTPSILTILGVIMYLRLPTIVGEAGLLATIGIIVIAHIISATTGLSVSSIATDKKVKAGGTYYMISRSLGLPIGGTLGLALFVGLSFSVSLYLIGFSESFLNYWGFDNDINSIRIAGTIALLVVTTVTFISTSLAIKMQYFIMTAIGLSLLSIFLGKHEFNPEVPLISNPSSAVPFMVLFGIFFPAVTGFEAGVSMSGDLKDPKKSIPKGSIMAIVVGFAAYIFLAFFFSYTVDGELLRNDPQVLLNISWIPGLVIAGIWGATVSSALGSILGAPRILQATAVDKISPKVFAKGAGASNEPRNALLLTFVIAECGILIGELDVIARIVSIFFITTYGFLNLSCAFEAWTSADFRPSFKTPVWVSFLGAAACFIVMIQLDFVATIAATIVLGLLFLYLKRKELSLQSGDAWSGVWATLVKTGIDRLNKEKLQARNWRPNIIMFSGDGESRPYMAELGVSIAGKLGILSSFELIESEKSLLLKSEKDLAEDQKEGEFFHRKHHCNNIYSGMDEISRVYGFSGIEPNTILMGWSHQEKYKSEFLNLIRNFERNNYNSIFLHYNREKKFGESKSIDIWWSGWGKNLSFAINLLRHITTSGMWKEATVRLLVINPDNTRKENIYKTLERIIDYFRVSLEIKVINNGIDKLATNTIIESESRKTDLTIIGIPDSQYDDLEITYQKTSEIADKLGTTLFINASPNFEEYSLDLYRTDDRKDQKDVALTLPELKPVKYPEVNAAARLADVQGIRILNEFYHKAFYEFFSINRQAAKQAGSLAESISASLQKLIETKDAYRAEKALSKIKSEFYYNFGQLHSEIIERKLEKQKDALELGIEWYLETIAQEVEAVPSKLKIEYPVEDLKPQKEDPGAVKWMKFKKRFWHPFAKQNIPVKVDYRRAAKYYLYNNRLQFIASYLKQFQDDSLYFLNQLQSLFRFADTMFDKADKAIEAEKLSVAILNEIATAIEEKAASLQTDQEVVESMYRARLLAEFRKNLQIFANDLEKLRANRTIRKKTRARKYYRNIKNETLQFATEWQHQALLSANRNFLESSLLSFEDRVYHEMGEFNQTVLEQTGHRLLKSINEIREQLIALKNSKAKSKEFKMPKIPGRGDGLVADFEERSKKIVGLTSALPEKITISTVPESASGKGETEAVDISASKIARHFLEAQFLGSATEILQNSSETIDNIVFSLNDILSLTKFTLDNRDDDLDDTEKVMQDAVQKALTNIDVEEERVNKLIQDTEVELNLLLEDLFESLSTHKIGDSAREFSFLIRDFQGKRVINKFEGAVQKVGSFFKGNWVKLLYSKSEGILLAQRLADSDKAKTVGEKVLDIVDHVTPDFTLLDRLPHFYKNLFSGRSSIGESFWIKRPAEWELLKKALQRYQSGYHGALLILGERNAGKTAFCSQISKKKFSNDKVYQLFPPPTGSSKAADFVRELSKTTSLSGSLEEIMYALPHQSVVVIHDLELWWERSAEGYEVIRTVEWLINTFSYKCLFIVNTNPFAFELINKVHPIDKLFIGTIKCRPFRAEELKDLVMSRHRSSGLGFAFENRKNQKVSEVKLAGLFNKYFDYAEGNPGVTLNGWLANIKYVSSTSITIKKPEAPNLKVLEDLPGDWRVILVQLVIHKRLTYEQLLRMFEYSEYELQDLLQALSRCGLIKERTRNVYLVNPYIEPFVLKVFKQKEWL